MSGVVILGAGQAGLQAAASLRQMGYRESVTIVGDEDRMPYQRPPLSKAYLKGVPDFDSLLLRPETFYAANAVELRLGSRVERIDREARRIEVGDGSTIAYDHLILASGARNRRLDVPGVDLPGVHSLRSASDAEILRDAFAGGPLVVIGGGFIGLEIAAVARARGLEVVVLEAAGRLMGRAVSPAVSAFFLEAHRAMGSEIVVDARVSAIEGEGTQLAVVLQNGVRHAGRTVLLAAGVVPNQEIAAAAGLSVANGILVDRSMRTDDPAIYAIGDCASFEARGGDGRVRLESVQNAIDQAKVVAESIMGVDGAAYDSVPWFWSDQGAFKLQMVGLTGGADDVHCVASADGGRLVAYCFAGERLLGIETVNAPGEHMCGRRILAKDLPLRPADVRREGFDLKSHIAALEAGQAGGG